MFCNRCGTKALDDADFCQKCGAKLFTGADENRQTTNAWQTQPGQSPNGAQGKKKRKKWPVVLGVAGGLVCLLILLASMGGINDSQNPMPENSDAVGGETKLASDADAVGGEAKPPSDAVGGETKPLSDVVDARPLYNGIPIDTIMEMSAEDVIAAFGEPSYQDEYFLEILNEEGSHTFILTQFDSTGHVFNLVGDPEKFELNGQNFYQDFDGLVAAFGREPDYQEKFDLLELTWYYDDYSILIGLDNDGLPGKTEAWKKITMEEAERRINEWLENGHQMWDNSYLEYAGEGILRDNGAELYNFRLMISEGAWLPIAVEKVTGTMWVVSDDGNNQTLDEYYDDYYIESFGNAEPVAAANNLSNGFIWVEAPTGSIDQWSSILTITGIVQNASSNTYSYAQITFNLYDSSGNQVGTAWATISNLKAGGTWKFEAMGSGSNVSRFELGSIDAY